MAKITEHSDHIKVKGHVGTWYVINVCNVVTDFMDEIDAKDKYYLLEHEEYGDMVACVIVDGDGNLMFEDVWNGFEEDDFMDYIYSTYCADGEDDTWEENY